MEQGASGTGPTRSQSMCEKDHVRDEMEQEQSRCNRAIARERKRVKTETKGQRIRRE